MTRLLTTGYETGDVTEAGTSTVGANSSLTVVGSAPTPRAGSYCLKVATTASSITGTYKTLVLPAAKTEVWIRFAFFTHALVSASEPVLAMLLDAGGSAQCNLTYNAGDGLLRFNRGSSSSTLLAAASTSFPQDSWHVIEWRVQILTATTGAGEVWLDGNRVINFSGDVANTATLNVQSLVLGVFGTVSGITGGYLAFDDIAVNDVAGSINNTRAGDGRVVLLVPNGAGSSTQLTRGGTDTGANYSQVNELPPSIAQYVGSATVAQRDLYTLADIPIAVSSINVVEALVLAQNSDAGGGSIGPTIKSGATINEAAAIGLSTSPAYVGARWETDPNTTAAWTVAAVNALEAGVTVR